MVLRYKWVILALTADFAAFAWNPVLGRPIALRTTIGFVEMLRFLPPVFIILGLLDVWVPREIVISHLGGGSGLRGMALAIF